MPQGSRHRLEGLLLIERNGPVLAPDGGGRWRLELDPGHGNLVGRRVLVEGVRTGFDLLRVEAIHIAESAP